MWFSKKKRAGSTGELPIELTPAYTKVQRTRVVSRLNMAYWSHIGMVRQNNEDSFSYSEELVFSYNEPKSVFIVVVADGMGGLELGEEASSGAINLFQKLVKNRLIPIFTEQKPLAHNHIQSLLREIVIETNHSLFEHFQHKQERSGSTLSAVVIFGEQCYIAHIGDSRIYLLDQQQKKLQQLTTDHSYVGRLVEMGQLSVEEAKVHPRRNEIYKMLAFEPSIEPDTSHFLLEPNQAILLCSDGLTDMVEDREILEHALMEQTPQEKVDGLGHLANKRGGYDNCTIVYLEPIFG